MEDFAPIQIESMRPADLTTTDIAVWRGLQVQSGLTSPFLSPDWAIAAAKSGGPDTVGARVAVLRQLGESVGFFAVRVRGDSALPIGAPLCDYQGLVARPGVSVDPVALVRALGVCRFDFQSLLADQPAFQPFHRGRAVSHVIDLSAGFEAYAAVRRAAGTDIFQDTAKKRRKLEREHGAVSFEKSRDNRAFSQVMEWKRAQYHATGQTDIFQAGWTLDLLQSLFDAAPEDDESAFGGTLFTLQIGEKLAAAHFALRQGPVLHAWFIAHDQAFSKYSPGLILIAEILQWAARQGITEVDLGPGDYEFKVRLANVSRPVAHGYVGLPSLASAVREVAYQVRTTAEALPLGRLSALPGKAMRRLDLIRSLA